jgi:hypothetical protein
MASLVIVTGLCCVAADRTPDVAPVARTPFQFVIGESLVKYMMTKAPESVALLNGTHPWIIMASAGPYTESAPPEWKPQYMIRFANEGDMEAQFAAGKIPSFVSWVMYDNEPHAFPSTPPNELEDPPLYYDKAAKLIHGRKLLFMATAGLSGDAQEKQRIVDLSPEFDAYDLQTQTGETTVSEFDEHIRNQSAKFRARNPKIIICAGFGDFAHKELLTPEEIVPFLVSMPSNVPVWPNFGPHEPPGKEPIPGHYDYFIKVLESTANMKAGPPLR